MDAEAPPNPHISPPQVVALVGWLLVAVFVVSTFVRLGTKVSLKRKLGVDDALIVFVMLLGTGQMVATHVQTRPTNIDSLINNDSNSFQQAFYASQLLFIPTIYLVKLSILHSYHQITPVREHKLFIIAFAAVVGLILLAFEFSAAFQCRGDRWNILFSQCFDQTAFWQAFGTIDIFTDLIIGIFPIYIVSIIQMNLKYKVIVAGVFGLRIVVVAASVIRLVFVTRSHANIFISTYDFWIFILSTEIEQGLSITTACVPFLKPFFESLETGMLAPSHGLTTLTGSGVDSRIRSKKTQNSDNSFKLSDKSDTGHGIYVSRVISSHSDERSLIT